MHKSSNVALIVMMIALLGGVAIGVVIPFDTVRDRVSNLIIVDTKLLVQSVTIRVSGDMMPPQLNAGDLISRQPGEFVVESLIKPGSMAQKGATLCHLSYHGFLAVEGHAYEKDLVRVRDSIITAPADS